MSNIEKNEKHHSWERGEQITERKCSTVIKIDVLKAAEFYTTYIENIHIGAGVAISCINIQYTYTYHDHDLCVSNSKHWLCYCVLHIEHTTCSARLWNQRHTQVCQFSDMHDLYVYGGYEFVNINQGIETMRAQWSPSIFISLLWLGIHYYWMGHVRQIIHSGEYHLQNLDWLSNVT